MNLIKKNYNSRIWTPADEYILYLEEGGEVYTTHITSSSSYNSKEGLKLRSETTNEVKYFSEFEVDSGIESEEVWVSIGNYAKKRKVIKCDVDHVKYDSVTLETYSPFDMTNFIELSNGQWLFNYYGKYSPCLTFLIDKPLKVNTQFENINPSTLNLPEGSMSRIVGKYWTSKKGTKCFKIDENGPHQLIKDSWGGCFNKYRGRTILNQSECLYSRRASSNGGGSGTDYAVFPLYWKYKQSIDDI